MDKGKKQIPKKLKTSEIIIFTPQELVDLGILQNIHQVQKSPDVKSKANKKRIIEVIQKSLNASKEQPSTSKSSQLFPVVDSQELKRNLMHKLSASSSTNVNVSKKDSEGSKTPVKVLNSAISIPKIPLTSRGRTKSANSGILLPSSVNKKLKKKTENTTPLTKNTSILIKDVRIKEIIMSAVKSNSKEGFPSNTSVETKLPESETSTILAKSPTTPGAEETTDDYNLKENNTDIEGKSTQEKSEYKDIQPDRSAKKQIRVVSNTQLSLTKEELKDLITPQMHSNNHELKTESQDLKNVDLIQKISLKKKDRQVLNKSTKVDAVTDGATSARPQNPSLPMKDLGSNPRNYEKSKCYYNKRKCDEKETELNLTNVTPSNIDREIEKSNLHGNAKHKLISSNSNTADIIGSNDICNKSIDVVTREMHTIQKNCSSEISPQVLDKRNQAKEGVDLITKRNVSNTKLTTASSSSMTQNEDMLLEKDISDCCSNEETQEKSVEIIVDAKEVCESQKYEEFINHHLLPNELTNDDITILEEPKQCQNLKISSEESESTTTVKSVEGKCELLGKTEDQADLLDKSKNDDMDILDKNSEICKKYISKKISQKAPETIKTISKSEAMMKSKNIGLSKKMKSTSEDIPISSVEIVNDNEVVLDKSNNLILDKEYSKAGKTTNNPADSVLNVEPSSTQTLNLSADADSSFETSEVKHTFDGKKRLYDKTALKMLMDVSKKTKNAAKICETKNPSPSECDNESEQTPSTMITEKLQLEETLVKTPKRRGRAPKNILNTTQTTECLNVTNIATSIPKVHKQTVEKVGLSDKKATSEVLDREFVAGPSNISKQRSSEIVLEMNSEEIATSTSTKEHEKSDDTANSLNSHKEDNLKQKRPSEEQSDVPIITPKKRGRPRKNPLDPPKPKKIKVDYFKESISNSSLDNITDVEMDVSKSGRKRRKINYFDLENSFADDTKIKNYSHIDEEKKPFKPNKRKMSFEGAIIQNSETSEVFERKPNINDTVLKPQPDTAVEALKLKPNVNSEILEDKGNISANNISVEHLDTSQTTLTEENTDENVENKVEQIKVKTKKYNKTGETQKMMQSIFSAAIKAVAPQNDNKEVVPGHQDNSEHQESPKPAVRYRGRPKKSQAGTSIVIDDEGKVNCCTCNTKVVNKEWQSHNRNVHYNLAWREGEQFVNVDNHVFVRRKLTPILQEDKYLVCSKCNKEFYVANEFILHREECLEIVKNSMVTCAICSEEIEQSKWMSHRKKKHNNLTWRVGDPPLDLNNQVLVLQVLNALYKAKIPLYCYKCRESKKSVIGFLSHQSQCGVDIENAKIPCPICGKRVLPVSMATHNKFVHEPKPPKPDEENEWIKGVLENGGVVNKRNAAKQAMKMIDIVSKSKLETVFAKEYVESPNLKEEEFVLKLLDAELKENDILKCKFGTCDVVYKQWEQMVEHLDECTQKPEQYFVCKRCFAIFLLEEEIRNHVRDQHNINLRDDADYEAIEGSDGEEEEKFRQELLKIRRHQIQQVARNIHVKIKPRFLHRIPKAKNRLCTSAFEYTLEFYNEHYTESVLFDRLRYLKSDWTLVNDEFLDDYLPKIEHSCHFTTKMVSSFDNMLKYDHEFSSLEIFDVIEHEDGATLFCGGPVTAMTWLPTPHILLYCKQILAVAVSKDFESKYLLNTNYMEPCIIQFWDFGVLKKKIKPQKPKFLFGLAINYGPIWHMEWCPSGCYDEKVFNNDKMQRMGLLAVAGSVSTVNIYSIPFIKDEDNMHLIYQAKPLVRLKLFKEYDNTKAKCFPTRISWSKASGHRYVAVGYSDGMVALFDIETTSDILKFTDDLCVDTILPYKTLKAHMYYISILSLIHLGGGTRYLLTGSFDRNVHVWDLTDNTSSLFARKKVLSDGTWLTNWIAFATTVDENTTNSGPATTCITSHRNYMYDITHIMGSPSSLTSLSSSDWLNGLLHGTSCGETLVTFPGQLLFGLDTDKRIKSLRWMLGYTKLINMSLTPEERIKEDEEEKKMTQSLPKPRDCDRDTAAYIFNQGDRLKKYQPHTYEKTVEKYGLVICDIKRKSFEEAPNFNLANVLETSRPDLYPLQAINKVAFNPNSQSSLYFAAGYQAGFVRLRYMKFLENDKQVV